MIRHNPLNTLTAIYRIRYERHKSVAFEDSSNKNVGI